MKLHITFIVFTQNNIYGLQRNGQRILTLKNQSIILDWGGLIRLERRQCLEIQSNKKMTCQYYFGFGPISAKRWKEN